LTDDNPYPNYPHFYQLSGWSNAGSKVLESKGIEKVLCPVGFVGAAESKDALREWGQIPFAIVQGRLGGSAITVAAINALATTVE
jgi:precorrin isomerase